MLLLKKIPNLVVVSKTNFQYKKKVLPILIVLKMFCHCSCEGFVIVGEDNTGKLDLGIFIASIVPDGPADKDGRIRPGKLLTLFSFVTSKDK